MDRFIADKLLQNHPHHSGLKSNMDRFIEVWAKEHNSVPFLFKIQYG